jgi:hypothetical protein
MFGVFVAGALSSALVGLAAGWVRYWMGFFILGQGAIASLLIAWFIRRYCRRRPDAVNPSHRSALALGWLAIFWIAQIYGLGSAQPGFDPLGYFGRILRGHALEMVFGIRAVAGWAKSFSGGFGGGMWVLLNVVDSAIMYFFLFRMSWPDSPRPALPVRTEGCAAVNAYGGEP